MGNYIKEISIIGLVAIELYALHKGIDGAYLAAVVAAISGIAGFVIGSQKEKAEAA
jgi:hypothetical protein